MTDQGRHAFDFVFGSWTIGNRKLRDVADPACEEWVEFDATCEIFPVRDGLGHVDRMYVPDPPEGSAFEGFTFRLFDPVAATWQIWWSSTRAPGVLDPPVIGRFSDDTGVFECEDVVGGHQVLVRFEWIKTDPTKPVWQQSFSYDGGATRRTNWVMSLRR